MSQYFPSDHKFTSQTPPDVDTSGKSALPDAALTSSWSKEALHADILTADHGCPAEPPPSYNAALCTKQDEIQYDRFSTLSSAFHATVRRSVSTASSSTSASVITDVPEWQRQASAQSLRSQSFTEYDSVSHNNLHTPFTAPFGDQQNFNYSGYAPFPEPLSPDAPHPDRVGRLVGGRSVEKLLKPAPPCFLRPLPCSESDTYPSFAPMAVPALSRTLAKGFSIALPRAPAGGLHPFASHDVREGDWMHFLADVKRAASLGWGDRVVETAPHLVVPIVPALLFGHLIKGHQKEKKRLPVMALVQAWNDSFFYPRRIEISVMELDKFGSPIYHDATGETGSAPVLPPDMLQGVSGDGWYMFITYYKPN